MENKKDLIITKENIIKKIKEISTTRDLTDVNVAQEMSYLSHELAEINDLIKGAHSFDNDLNSNNNASGYYESMSATYINDNGNIFEVYKINEKEVSKEEFDDWSHDYFNIIRIKKEQERELSLKNDIQDLEKQLSEKKKLLFKKSGHEFKNIPDIRESQTLKNSQFSSNNLHSNNNGYMDSKELFNNRFKNLKSRNFNK
ncbi:MAG: hypothetical protein ACRCW6_00020 [Mycoplasmoidaceae bacterium]